MVEKITEKHVVALDLRGYDPLCLIQDVRVGRNSQTVCAGFFRAGVARGQKVFALERGDTRCIPDGPSVFTTKKAARRFHRYLYPVSTGGSRTQVEGKLTALLVMPDVMQGIIDGSVEIALESYQVGRQGAKIEETDRNHIFDIDYENDALIVLSKHNIGVGDAVIVKIKKWEITRPIVEGGWEFLGSFEALY